MQRIYKANLCYCVIIDILQKVMNETDVDLQKKHNHNTRKPLPKGKIKIDKKW